MVSSRLVFSEALAILRQSLAGIKGYALRVKMQLDLLEYPMISLNHSNNTLCRVSAVEAELGLEVRTSPPYSAGRMSLIGIQRFKACSREAVQFRIKS